MAEVITNFDSKSKQLDERTRELYGLSFDEILDRCFQRAYVHGLGVGYRVGKTDGRRSAKGLKDSSKGRGRPPKMDKGLTALMVHVVRKAQTSGTKVEPTIRKFLESMRRGQKESGKIEMLPTLKEALAIYYRASKQTVAFKKPKKTDDDLRNYVRSLVK